MEERQIGPYTIICQEDVKPWLNLFITAYCCFLNLIFQYENMKKFECQEVLLPFKGKSLFLSLFFLLLFYHISYQIPHPHIFSNFVSFPLFLSCY